MSVTTASTFSSGSYQELEHAKEDTRQLSLSNRMSASSISERSKRIHERANSPSQPSPGEAAKRSSSPDSTVALNTRWSELGMIDTNSRPSKEQLIERMAGVMERYILTVLNWRKSRLQTSAVCPSTNHRYTHQAQSNCNTQQVQLQLPEPARSELKEYLTTIAALYNDVLYHNFEHAAHVTFSTDTMISMVSGLSWNVPTCSHSKPKTAKSSSVSSPSSSSSALQLHLSTYGLSSDPIMHLAMVFSALIHDVGHQGVGNGQLSKEESPIAVMYDNKSVAENNSISTAFCLLREDRFAHLRECMFGTCPQLSGLASSSSSSSSSSPNICSIRTRQPGEKIDEEEEIKRNIHQILCEDEKRFRRIVIDVILSTDITSKERLEFGTSKWMEAFENGPKRNYFEAPAKYNQSLLVECSGTWGFQLLKRKQGSVSRRLTEPSGCSELGRRRNNVQSTLTQNGYATTEYYRGGPDGSYASLDRLRASTILDQIIQGADVAHTMQAWPVFLKWNQKLYDELWAAFLVNRGPDCTANWFKGQIGFFDNYVLPLARRIKKCKVFGSSSSIFLDNAMENRRLWLQSGEQICVEMKATALDTLGNKNLE